MSLDNPNKNIPIQNNKVSDTITSNVPIQSNLPEGEKKELALLEEKEAQEKKEEKEKTKAKLNELNKHIENNYSELSKNLVWEEWIKEAQRFLWIEETWEYNSYLLRDLLDFQKKNNLEVDWVLWENTLKMMKNKEITNIVPWSESINELYEKITWWILEEYIWKLNWKDWVELTKEAIYENILSILEKSKNTISDSNIFSWDIGNFRKNFLEPREKWIKNIDYILGKVFPWNTEPNKERVKIKWFDLYKNKILELVELSEWTLNKEEIEKLKEDKSLDDFFKDNPKLKDMLDVMPIVLGSVWKEKFWWHLDWIKNNIETKKLNEIEWNDLDRTFEIAKSWIEFLFDSWNNKTEEEIKKQIWELKWLKEVSKLFEKIPDLENIFSQILPNIIKTTDKEVFSEALEVFYKNVKNDILKYSLSEWDISEKNLNSSKLNIINKFSVLLWSIINEESTDVFTKELWNLELIKGNKKITRILDLVNDSSITKEDKLNISRKVIDWLELFSSKDLDDWGINQYINSLNWIIKDLTWKIPDEKLTGLIRDFYGIESWEKLDINYMEWLKIFLWNENIRDVFYEYIKNNRSPEEFILFLIKDGKIDWSINDIWWEVAETIKKIINIDLVKTIKDVRKEILENDETDNIFKENQETKVETIEKDLILKIQDKAEKSIYALINNKINNKENNILNKNELINIAIDNIKQFLWENQESLTEYVKELWIKIGSEKDLENINEVINNVLENPRINNIISDIISNIWKEIKWKDDIPLRLKNLFDDVLEGKWASLLNKTNKSELTYLALDSIFDSLSSTKNLETSIKFLKENLWVNLELNNNEAKELILLIKKHISKEDIKRILDNNPDIFSKNITNEEKIELMLEVYKWVDDKLLLLNSFIDKDLLKLIKNNWEIRDLKAQEISVIWDWIYNTLNWNDKKDLSKVVSKIIDKFWLWELNEVVIFWRNLWENIITILNALEQKEFEQILDKNNEDITKLRSWKLSDPEKTKILAKIWADIIEKIDLEEVNKDIKELGVLGNEKLLLWLLPELQKALKEDKQKIDTLASKSIDVYNIFLKEWRNISYNSPEAENIWKYWEEVFNVLKSLINNLPNWYLSNNIKESSNEKKGRMKTLIDWFTESFLWNNKLFVISELFSWIFDWEFDTWKSIEEYLKWDNKENFWETVKRYFVKLNNPELNSRTRLKKPRIK